MRRKAWGVSCNVIADHSHKFVRPGARCWVTNFNLSGENARCEIVTSSRASKLVKTWMQLSTLENFRVALVFDVDAWVKSGLGKHGVKAFVKREIAEDGVKLLDERRAGRGFDPESTLALIDDMMIHEARRAEEEETT